MSAPDTHDNDRVANDEQQLADDMERPAKPSKHRATYATDTRNGGYMIRVAGPYPEKFAGREVPVITKAGVRHTEKLLRLIWQGIDNETKERVALYKFESRPREEQQLEF